MSIPNLPLNQLEREPIVHFGCTYSEIIRCGVSGIFKGFFPGLLASFIHISLGILLGFILWLVMTSLIMKKLARTRADKPIFYENHLVTKKRGGFIKPGISYQRERNARID